MGGVSSQNFTEMVEEDSSVPVRTVEPSWDPRSPSHNIARTPIQVEATPTEPMVDPRSPTIGIMRTPIFQADEESTESRSALHRPSPLVIDDTPTVPRSETRLEDRDGEDTEEAEEEWESIPSSAALNRSASEPELSNQEEDVMLLTSRVQARLSFSDALPTKQKSPRILFPSKEDPVSSVDKPKPVGKAFLKSSSEHQRSPLSTRNVDVNSPRAIVQRKQANRLGMLKSNNVPLKRMGSPRKYTAFQDDKENMDV